MILVEADKSGQMLTMSYSQCVLAADMRECLENVRGVMDTLQPGFVLITDLSALESMDPSCAGDLGEIMSLCQEKEVKTVVRVIPDPSKDIGFALIARFHHHPDVHTRTYESLTDALQSLAQRS